MPAFTDIRNALQTECLKAASFGATQVIIGRYAEDAIPDSLLPYCGIHLDSSAREPITMGSNRTFEVVEDYIIEVIDDDGGESNADTNMDNLVEELRAEIEDDRTLGGNSKDCYISEISYEGSDAGDKTRLAATLNVRVHRTETV